jgi:hypothetical protein
VIDVSAVSRANGDALLAGRGGVVVGDQRVGVVPVLHLGIDVYLDVVHVGDGVEQAVADLFTDGVALSNAEIVSHGDGEAHLEPVSDPPNAHRIDPLHA